MGIIYHLSSKLTYSVIKEVKRSLMKSFVWIAAVNGIKKRLKYFGWRYELMYPRNVSWFINLEKNMLLWKFFDVYQILTCPGHIHLRKTPISTSFPLFTIVFSSTNKFFDIFPTALLHTADFVFPQIVWWKNKLINTLFS